MGNKWITLFLHRLWKMKFRLVTWLGGKTLGARALVIRNDEVLLVRHTYCEGWYTIGGTVDKGEMAITSIIRELQEEASLIPLEAPQLFGIYFSQFEKRDNHIILYIIKNFSFSDEGLNNGLNNKVNRGNDKNGEIAEIGWFNVSNLPDTISKATRRRVEEYIGARIQTEEW